MAAIEAKEIVPGLNAFLDPAVLATSSGVQTNASAGRAVTDPHFFLVVEVDADKVCLCIPLFSNQGDKSIKLDSSLKTGPGSGWTGRDSYFSPFQFWRIPIDAYVAASKGEMNAVGNRQHYAANDAQALADIASHKADSRDAYHSPTT